MKKVELTDKEINLLDQVLNTIVDSDYFSERQPKGIKSPEEANRTVLSIIEKINT